jgi:hypothetical protein
MSLTITGQINRVVLWWDDGGMSRTYYGLDNTNSSSRFSLLGSAKVNPKVSMGFEIMIEIEAGGTSSKVSQLDEDGRISSTQPLSNFVSFAAGNTDAYFGDARRVAGWVEHADLGRLTIGRFESAGVVNTIDLGGIGVVAGPSFALLNGFFFMRSANTGQLYNTIWGHHLDPAASQGRTELVRYDSPSYQGFIYSASVAEAGDYWGTMLRYANEFNGVRVAAGIGFEQIRDTNLGAAVDPTVYFAPINEPKTRAWGGGLSLLHVASGLFIQGHYQAVEYGFALSDNYWGNALICSPASSVACSPQGVMKKKDANQWLIQGGLAKNHFGFGITSVYGEYGKAEDWGALDNGTGRDYPVGGQFTAPFNTPYINSNNFTGIQNVTDTEVNIWGLGIVQNFDAAATELYLGYRNFSAKLNGVEVVGSCSNAAGGGNATTQTSTGGVVTSGTLTNAVNITCTQTATGRTPNVEDMHVIAAGIRIKF